MREDESFDPSSLCEEVAFTQAAFYGDWQRNLGRIVRRFLVYKNDEIVSYFQIVKFSLFFGKSYLYVPYGPVTKDSSKDFFENLKLELELIAKVEKAVFVRLDFTPFVSGDVLTKFFYKAPLYTYQSANFQPRVEWFLGLKKTENELLLGMHEKTRYSIRLAEKKGIAVEIVTNNFEKYFEIFYKLMERTAERNSFGLHQKKYYKTIFENLSRTSSYLSVARYGEKILAIDLVIVFGKTANYVFGCSSNEERNRMPAYLAQWEAICYAKELNCDYYNFGGISAENNIYKGWEGLTIFKKKFGGKEVRHSDFFDVVVNPFLYHLYNFRKRLKKMGL